MSLITRFIDSYNSVIQARMEALVDTIQTNHSFTDLEEFLTLSVADVANDIAGLPSNHDFITGFADELKDNTIALLSTCNPTDNIEERFYSMFGSNLSSGVRELVTKLTEKAIINSYKDIATVSASSIENTIAALPCTATLTQGFSSNLLSDIGTFLNNVTRQISFTGAAHPENNVAVPLYIKCFDEDNSSALIGEQITTSNGVFEFSYSETIPEDGSYAPKDLKFEVYVDSTSGSPFDTAYKTFDPETESSFTINISNPPAPADTSPDVSDLTTVGITFPTGFLTYLSGKGVTTLQDVREKGGIYHFDDLPSGSEIVVAAVDNYASLNLLTDDLTICQTIFDAGYENIPTIINTPRAKFISDVNDALTDPIDTVPAGRMYSEAQAVGNIQNSVVWGSAVARKNGFDNVWLQNISGSQTISSLLSTECNCDDCESGVSPLAYLSSLIKYITDNVKDDGAVVNVSFLESNFYQPFGKLSTDCEEVDKKVCQIRVCIDVLRKYYEVNGVPSQAVTFLRQSTKEYLIEVYNTILNRIGTSYEELKEVPEVEKESLALRLGVDKTKLLSLILDIVDADISTNDTELIAYENDLERIFGFPSTVRNPLSKGYFYIPSDRADFISRWDISGEKWNYNTDVNGYVYLEVVDIGSDNARLYLHKSNTFSESSRVATGITKYATFPNTITVNFTPLNNSSIFGNFEASIADPDLIDVEFSLIPEYVAWKLQKTSNEWSTVDTLLDNIFTNTDGAGDDPEKRHKYPYIDPDLISLDDIRAPFDETADTPSELWNKRRNWVDDIIGELYTDQLFASGTGPKTANVYTYLKGNNFSYNSSTPANVWVNSPDPVTSFSDWYKIITNPNDSAYNTQKTEIKTKLGLEPDEFIRLYELQLVLNGLGTANTEYSLTEEQRANVKEFIDIAIVSCKRKFFDAWIEEEQDNDIWLNQHNFYTSITRPKAGIWPQIIQPFKSGAQKVPFIEPGYISLVDMVDNKLLYHEYSTTTNLESVYNAYTNRKDILLADLSNIKTYRESQDKTSSTDSLAYGFERLITQANTGTGTTLFNYTPDYTGNNSGSFEARFFKLYKDINEGDVTEKANAIANMQEMPNVPTTQGGLVMTVPEFNELFDYYQTCLEQGLTDAQWQAVYELMQKGLKRKFYYTDWNAEEAEWVPEDAPDPAIPLKYWQVQKQKLVKWRATEENRRLWSDFLERTALPPAIDSDYIYYSNFIDPRDENYPSTLYTNIPYTLWEDRKGYIDTWRSALSNNINTYLIFIGDVYESYTVIDLYNDYLNKGKDISAELKQLNLTQETIEIIYKLKAKYPAGSITEVSDQTTAQDIILNIMKQRNTDDTVKNWAGWLREEAIDGIYISPQIFALPADTSLSFNLAVQADNHWLVNSQFKKEWQQKLTSRVNFQTALIKSHADLIESIEDTNLIQLRDALVTSTYINQFDQEKNAQWVTDNLLIDAKTNCCSATTRVAQAVETLQVFLFGIRNGLLEDNFPDVSIMNDYFDEHWQWLGSYEKWRALTFTYLYPENLLDPAYRQYQTGKFREITDAIISNSRFNPALADNAAKQYQEYFEDITTLSIVSSVASKVIDKGAKFRVFMFARGGKTGNLYWSSYDIANASGNTTNVATWEPVPGMADTARVAGATIFKTSSDEPFIYVMANLRKDKTTTIRFNRYSLSKLGWDAESSEIEVDKKFNASTAVLENTFDPSQAPFVGIKLAEADTKRLFVLQFNKEGKAFTDSVRAIGAWVGKIHSLIRVKNSTGIQYTYCIADYKGIGDANPVYDFQLTTGMFKSIPDKQEDSEYWFGEKQFKPQNTLNFNIDNFIGAIYQDEVKRVHMYFKSKLGPSYLIMDLFEPDADPLNDILAEKTDVRDKNLSYIGPVNPIKLGEATNDEFFASISYGGIGGRLIRNGKLTLSKQTTPTSNIDFFWNEILKPVVDIAVTLNRKDNPDELQRRRFNIYKNLEINKDANQSQWVYLQEYYYFMPMLLAIQLQKNKFYTEALDWYKQVFDYSAPLGKRKIYYGLTMEENIATGNILNGNIFGWLSSPTDPHQIAALRPNNYTRFTVYSIVQCLLDFADTEYTRDTSESVPRARTLYSFALELLNEEVFTQQIITAAELINGLDWLITEPTVWDTWVRIKNLLRKVDDYDTLYALVNQSSGTITDVITDSDIPEWEDKIEKIIYLIETALQNNKPKVAISTQVGNTQQELLKMHLAASAIPAMRRTASSAMVGAGSDYSTTMSSTTGVRIGYYDDYSGDFSFLKDKYEVDFSFDQLNYTPTTTADLYAEEYKQWQQNPATGMLQNQQIRPAYLPLFTNYYCVVPNPIPDYMRMHADIQLLKIRNCMNISGLRRELDPYAAPIDATSGIPSLIGGGRLNVTSTIPRSATIYRYQFLIERAKQLVSYAQQMEGSLLSALEKRDAEYYTLMKARQDLNISRANVKLNDLRLNEAESGVTLAQYQLERSETQVFELDNLINAGLNSYEAWILQLNDQNAVWRIISASANAVFQTSELIVQGLSSPVSAADPRLSIAQGLGLISRGVQLGSDIALILNENKIQNLSLYASQARREQEWNYQKTLATKDIKISKQQVKVAEDRVKVVGQEKQIAEMQSGYAEDTLNFLSTKFTNVQLYEWMVRILQRTYDFMLQQATSVAKTAQLQLAFERQETPTGIIQDDYWEAPAEGGSSSADRRGLTGSTRLLADIVKLESYAIDTNRRKLQMTKTISLATYFPIEFQQFRETGQFNFQTTLQHFDRDFPGHYLRLIRSVRTSVIALTPPNEGIKATLSNTGTSTVIIKANSAFVPIRSRKDPESVALTSPYNASGMFELQQQDPNIYLPFEGTGVETVWYFEMLKANNPFDFNTIADVILTVEYSALEDYNYKVQKWNENNSSANADGTRLFSLKNDFPDQWYDLNNDAASVKFDISRLNFPANIVFTENQTTVNLYVNYKTDLSSSNSKITGIAIDFNSKNIVGNQQIDVKVNELASLGIPPTVSTPFGEWMLTMGIDGRTMIKNGDIEDILFAVNYKANSIAYPKIS